MSEPWTKAEEIAHYRQFVESLPRNSYLADILAGTVELVEREIRSDMASPLIHQSVAARLAAEAETQAVQRQVIAERAALQQAERDTRKARETLDELRQMARRIFQTA
jgi:hypothetical protein